jgi:large subunit ribosomal protein L33
MASKDKKNIIALACEACKNTNYTALKSDNMKEKMLKNKYCSTCKKHTSHKETKVK